MCGRLFIKPITNLDALLEALRLFNLELPVLHNVAPTDPVPLIYHDGTKYAVRGMRWWLHASWHREPPNQTHPSFNARIETILTLSSFRVPVRKQRGIVVADAFVEWQKHKKGEIKQPYYVQGKSEPLLLAAVWDVWNNDTYSCAIVTQEANEDFAQLHDRMPLSLTINQALRWLDPNENAETLINDFKGASIELIQRKVSPAINNARVKVEVEFT